MRLMSSGLPPPAQEGEHKCLNSELWHACAGPLVSLPAVGTRVVYFPQGHSEQIAASTSKEIDTRIPNYPTLPPQLICQLHNLTMHADPDTDEVYTQMTLQPLSPQEQKDLYLPAELGTASRQPTNYFCKTLTASDTSTHGGFSVPRRAAEKVFPPLDFSQQPPAQELIAKDLHGNEWKFRHIFRGQPKRHLLTTGWSVFVSAKRLVAGDAVLFIWNESNQLLLGIRRANRPQTITPSSVLSSDSMHIGLLAAAAHAAATNSRFTIFYNPRTSPSEFVIPLTKYVKAVYHTRVSVGMRFRMLFETEESSVRRYMGTITGISDLDPVRWSNSHWRSVKVGWDESTAGERQPRVSLWEIEPLTTFPMYPSAFPLRLKRPWPSGLPSLHGDKGDDIGLNSSHLWVPDGEKAMQSLNFQGFGMTSWLQPRIDASVFGLQPNLYQAMAAAALQEMRAVDPSKETSAMLQFQQPQNMPSISAPPLASNVLQQMLPQSQQTLLQTVQGSQTSNPNQCQPQLQQSNPLSNHQQQHLQPPQFQQQQVSGQQDQLQHQHLQHKHFTNHQQVPSSVPTLSQIDFTSESQPSSLPSVSSFYQQQNRPDNSVAHVPTSGVSPFQGIMHSISPDANKILSLPRTTALIASSEWSSPKRLAIEPMLSPGAPSVQPQADQLGAQTNISQQSVRFPSFSERDCSIGQECNTDPQNHQLFGVNIDSSSLLMQNGVSSLRSIAIEPTSTLFLSNAGTNFPLNHNLSNSSCLDGSGLLQTPDNMGHDIPQHGTFVKVYKSGSFGRSLDITKFNSYHELRSELGRLFGLDGQLEDPLRSGWQLVFVDRENDILLLGDDPWHEFVNNVWCIKILSPEEVQQMGTDGADLLSSDPVKRHPGASCDEYVGKRDLRMASLGSLYY